jgi:hypothetical protein
MLCKHTQDAKPADFVALAADSEAADLVGQLAPFATAELLRVRAAERKGPSPVPHVRTAMSHAS